MSRTAVIVLPNVLMVEEGGVAPPSDEPYLGFIEYILYHLLVSMSNNN